MELAVNPLLLFPIMQKERFGLAHWAR